MGGLVVSIDQSSARRAETLAIADMPFHKAGLDHGITIERPGISIRYYPKYKRSTSPIVKSGPDDFALAVGTLVFERLTGQQAVERLLEQPDIGTAIQHCRGHFLLVVYRRGQLTIRADLHGTYELYRDNAWRLFSTSFLGLATCLNHITPHAEACLEYVIGGVTLGTTTPVVEIERLDIGETITVADGAVSVARHKPRLVEPKSPAPLDQQIEQTLTSLRAVISDYAAAFGNNLRLSFSGGYDSRLLLALARDCGADPHLFVYGSPQSSDVRLAAAIAKSEGASFEHIDKLLVRPVTAEDFPEMVNASYEMNDAFSQYWMFCSDSENYARIDRTAGGGILMNGGGGEVMRNFFKFRGQPMSVTDFVHGFFSPYDPATLADPQLGKRYQSQLATKIIDLFDLDGETLSPAHVESLYPHLRCRSWFGRDTSLDNRFGGRATPYLEPQIVATALQVPLRWKHFGVFQARLIKALSPKLAAHMSSHGYAFDRDPPWRSRLGDLRLFAQPLRTRPYNSRLRQLRSRRAHWPKELSRDYIASVIDPSFPVMSSIFHPDAVRDVAQFQRICVIEYMFKQLSR